MKMYEKLGMSTEDALKWVATCFKRACDDCPANKIMPDNTLVSDCPCKFLLSDVPELPKIPRWMTAKTQEDFDRLFDGFKKFCKGTDCVDCKYYKIWAPAGNGQKDCYYVYLSELVEAPESEADNG